MALIHHQFESIHPFYDGNGRTGRILNDLVLIQAGLLDIPTGNPLHVAVARAASPDGPYPGTQFGIAPVDSDAVAMASHDLDVDEITVAALLHEAAEIICWCFAPTLTEAVYDMQRTDRNLRSVAAQRQVFKVSAHDLQLSLVRQWHLPELLVSMMDSHQINNPRVATVKLANNLARHTAQGWDNAAIPDDLAETAKLLGISEESLLDRLRRMMDNPPPPPAIRDRPVSLKQLL